MRELTSILILSSHPLGKLWSSLPSPLFTTYYTIWTPPRHLSNLLWLRYVCNLCFVSREQRFAAVYSDFLWRWRPPLLYKKSTKASWNNFAQLTASCPFTPEHFSTPFCHVSPPPTLPRPLTPFPPWATFFPDKMTWGRRLRYGGTWCMTSSLVRTQYMHSLGVLRMFVVNDKEFM